MNDFKNIHQSYVEKEEAYVHGLIELEYDLLKINELLEKSNNPQKSETDETSTEDI